MVGGRTERGSRLRTRTGDVVVPFPRGGAGDRLDLARFVPSGRVLIGAAVSFVLVLGAYWGAHATSVFAVERVEVQGAPQEVARQIESVTGDVVGRSLLSVDGKEIEDTVRALPSVAGVSVDRAFPHALVIRVAPERPVAVVRRGKEAWLVAGSGKVIREFDPRAEQRMPRIWVTRDVVLQVGRPLPADVIPAAKALGAVGEVGLRRRVKTVRLVSGELVVVLQRGPELRLGAPVDVLLKLAVAGRVLPLVDDAAVYLDVSVPERPVAASFNS